MQHYRLIILPLSAIVGMFLSACDGNPDVLPNSDPTSPNPYTPPLSTLVEQNTRLRDAFKQGKQLEQALDLSELKNLASLPKAV